MGFDFTKAVETGKARLAATRQRELEDAAVAIAEVFDRAADSKGNLDTVRALVDVAHGRNRVRSTAPTNGQTPEMQALETLLSSDNVPGGVKQALRRLLNEKDPGHIPVEADGTPVVVKGLKANVERLEAETSTLRGKLTDTESRLATAQAATKVDVKAVQDHLSKAVKATDKVKSVNRLSLDVTGTDEVKAAINNAKNALVPSAPAPTPAPATP